MREWVAGAPVLTKKTDSQSLSQSAVAHLLEKLVSSLRLFSLPPKHSLNHAVRSLFCSHKVREKIVCIRQHMLTSSSKEVRERESKSCSSRSPRRLQVIHFNKQTFSEDHLSCLEDASTYCSCCFLLSGHIPAADDESSHQGLPLLQGS